MGFFWEEGVLFGGGFFKRVKKLDQKPSGLVQEEPYWGKQCFYCLFVMV